MTSDLLLRGARPYGGGEPLDVLLSGEAIAAVAPSLSAPGVEVVDLDGRYVGPGLWDNHVHFTQWVIQQRRVDLAGTRSASDAVDVVRAAIAAGFPMTDGVLFGYGYRDGLWTEEVTKAALDVFAQPVVLINGDLHSAWMNTAGAARLGLTPDASGVVSEGEWIGTLQRFHAEAALPASDYAAAAAAAAARGIVGVVEYENVLNIDEWAQRVAQGVTSLRVEASVWPDRLDVALSRGLHTGDPVEPSGLITMGRLKVVTDGSLNTRTAYCWDPYPGLDAHAAHGCGVSSVSIDELRELLVRARAGGIGAAVHAIGDRANSETLDVFEELGMPGIIEHAQLLRTDDFARFSRLGLIASVQPEHAMDDRDVADRYWEGRTDRAFAFGSLHAAGVALRLGSDAPVAPLDPWHAIASGVLRSRGDREPWHPEQSLPLDVALAASTRHPLAEGAPADVVITDADPFALDRDALRAMPVSATLLGGRFTHRAL